MNLFGKSGYLTDDERKQPLVHNGEYFTFKTCVDLSEPIHVIPHGSSGGKYPLNWYSRDIADFIIWWSDNVHKDLNGFGGFHNVKFEPCGFDVIQQV